LVYTVINMKLTVTWDLLIHDVDYTFSIPNAFPSNILLNL